MTTMSLFFTPYAHPLPETREQGGLGGDIFCDFFRFIFLSLSPPFRSLYRSLSILFPYLLPLAFLSPLRPLSAGVLDHERSYRVKERRSERGKKKADTFSDFFRVSFSFPFSPFSLSSSATAMLSLSPMDLKKVSLGGIFSVVSPVISSVLLFCRSLKFLTLNFSGGFSKWPLTFVGYFIKCLFIVRLLD
jgi:hypothetical protein